MRTRLRVGFTGYYGMRNFGDDLFGLLCTEAAARYWEAEPLLVGPRVAGSRGSATMPSWYEPKVYGSTGFLGKGSRVFSFARAVAGSDVLVLGGGSVIASGESFRRPLMLAAHKHLGLQLAAVGVSIGPFSDSEAESKARAFAARLRYLSVRDRRSFELATRMGLADNVHAGRDLAGLLPLLFPCPGASAQQRAGRPVRIGLAPCNYEATDGYSSPERDLTYHALVRAVRMLTSEVSLQVDVFSLNEHPVHGDGRLADELHLHLKAADVDSRRVRCGGRGPLEVAYDIARCDAFISARLHGAIVSYVYGVPLAIVDYHPKCSDFAEDIGLPIGQRITKGSADAEMMADAMRSMLSGRGAPSLSHVVYAQQAQNIFTRAPWAVTT